MGPFTSAVAAIVALLGLVATLGISVVWMRRSVSTERDTARVNTIAAVRELVDVERSLGEARLEVEREWTLRLERHHGATHRRCQTGPFRGG